MIGCIARRKMPTSMTSSTNRIGAVTQPTWVEELGDDVVDQHVAMRQVLDDLDQHRVLSVERHRRPVSAAPAALA